jgi:uncharacterized protein with FMN-binding domain
MNKFWLKMMNLLLVAGLLLGYDGILEVRGQAEEIDRLRSQVETEKQKEEQYRKKADSLAEQLSQEKTEEENNEAGELETFLYQDGTYEGSADGYGGVITVQVTMESDTITDIAILSAPKEDRAYLEMASSVATTILEEQTTQVDTVSGATFSSTGIKNAVSDALEKAKNK